MAKPKPAPPAQPVVTIAIDDPADQKGKLRVLGGSKSDKWNRFVGDQVMEALSSATATASG